MARRAEELYSWDEVADRYAQLLEGLALGYNPAREEEGA